MGSPVIITPDPQAAAVTITPDAPPPPKPEHHEALEFAKDLWETAKGMGHTFSDKPQGADEIAAIGSGIPLPVYRMAKGYFNTVQGMKQKSEDYADKGETGKSMYYSAAAALPLVGPLLNGAPERAEQGGGWGLGLSRILQAASMAPEGSAIPNPAALVTKPLAAAVSKAREVGNAEAPGMYQEALKPSTSDPAKATRVVQNGLEMEIPVSKSGLAKLNTLLSDLNAKITDVIGDGQGKTVNKFKVASRLNETIQDARNQVNPGDDVTAIKASGDEFLKGNPTEIPAAKAQAMKVGTYERLGSKAYGPNPELKTATVEAQKSLARGLKDEVAVQFPELKNLNASESRLLDLQPVLEKAVTRIGNRSGIGIGSGIAAGGAKAITGSGGIAAVVGTMKAVFDNPSFKSRLAMALYQAGKKAGQPVTLPQATARVAAYVNALHAGAEPNGNADNGQ